MAQARKILVSDPDETVLRDLSRALRERSFQVSICTDGSRALEMAVLRHPDLVLFDEACRLVDARTFIQILRTNPRTEDIPVVVTGASADVERLRGFRDGYLRKPFNLDEVLGRIEHIFRKQDAAKELRTETRDIEGSLKQMGLADLLQILAQNRRSGRLMLEHGEDKGEIVLNEGRPVNAKSGPAEGDKALFRLLALKEGTFAFMPGPFVGAAKIRRGMEEALLEGMRQADEAGRLTSLLPPRQSRIAFAPDAQLGADLHPVTAEVVKLLATPRSLGEVVDLAQATDFEVLAALSSLLEKNLARVVKQTSDSAEGGPLMSPAELHALRARILRGRPASKLAVGKVMLLSENAKSQRMFLEALVELSGYRLVRPPAPELLGTWARIEFPDGLRVELTSVPGADEARPLWKPLASGALGALALDRGPATGRLANFVAREGKMPLLFVGPLEIPEPLKNLPGVAAGPVEAREALRTLLVTAARQSQPE